jgi:hypothetical protein
MFTSFPTRAISAIVWAWGCHTHTLDQKGSISDPMIKFLDNEIEVPVSALFKEEA